MVKLVLAMVVTAVAGCITIAANAESAPTTTAAAVTVATTSIENVQSAAIYSLQASESSDWITTLDDAANTATSNGSTSASGDVVTWNDGLTCYQAALPTPTTPVALQAC